MARRRILDMTGFITIAAALHVSAAALMLPDPAGPGAVAPDMTPAALAAGGPEMRAMITAWETPPDLSDAAAAPTPPPRLQPVEAAPAPSAPETPRPGDSTARRPEHARAPQRCHGPRRRPGPCRCGSKHDHRRADGPAATGPSRTAKPRLGPDASGLVAANPETRAEGRAKARTRGRAGSPDRTTNRRPACTGGRAGRAPALCRAGRRPGRAGTRKHDRGGGAAAAVGLGRSSRPA